MDDATVGHRLSGVKRLSPLLIIALAAAAAAALFRSSADSEPAENWKPVQPS